PLSRLDADRGARADRGAPWPRRLRCGVGCQEWQRGHRGRAEGCRGGDRAMIGSMTEVVDIVRHRELLRNLVLRAIKIRYKRSILGFVWVMLNPALTMLVLSVVFAELFHASLREFTPYVLSGLVLWLFFAQSTSVALKSFVGNGPLITTVALPKAVFPLSAVLSALVTLVLSSVPLFGLLAAFGVPLTREVVLLPVAILEVFVFACGVALTLSTVTVFFQDMTYIYDVLLVAWMYLTPIFYP